MKRQVSLHFSPARAHRSIAMAGTTENASGAPNPPLRTASGNPQLNGQIGVQVRLQRPPPGQGSPSRRGGAASRAEASRRRQRVQEDQEQPLPDVTAVRKCADQGRESYEDRLNHSKQSPKSGPARSHYRLLDLPQQRQPPEIAAIREWAGNGTEEGQPASRQPVRAAGRISHHPKSAAPTTARSALACRAQPFKDRHRPSGSRLVG